MRTGTRRKYVEMSMREADYVFRTLDAECEIIRMAGPRWRALRRVMKQMSSRRSTDKNARFCINLTVILDAPCAETAQERVENAKVCLENSLRYTNAEVEVQTVDDSGRLL